LRGRATDEDPLFGPLVATYLDDIGNYPLLSFEQEQKLFAELEKARESGDTEEAVRLKKEIVEANLRLVLRVARKCSKYVNPCVSFLDLVQAGNIGLMTAVDKFEYRRGLKLSTCAHWWIYQAITRTLQEQSSTIRIPVHLHGRESVLKKAWAELQRERGRDEVTIAALAETTGLSPEMVEQTLRIRKLKQLHSLDYVSPQDEHGVTTYGDLLPNPCLSPEEEAERRITREEIEVILDTLEERDRGVLRMRFGFDGEPESLQAISTVYGITRERVRQIQNKALAKLRHPLRAKRLRAASAGIEPVF